MQDNNDYKSAGNTSTNTDLAKPKKKPLNDALKANIWAKGQSGNPSGRPKLPECLKKNLVNAAETLIELLASNDENIRLRAAETILNRCLGKPTESHDVDFVKPLEVNHFVDRAKPETPEEWLQRVKVIEVK